MALNFPRPDQSPFVDPESGLKYIYNPEVGAWESAIQPPVIVTYDCNEPDIIIEGFLWYNNCDLTLYIYRNGEWIPVVDGEYGPVFIGINPPSNPNQGDLWWDPVSGNLFVYYIDPTSSQWIIANTGGGGGGLESGGAVVGPFAPGNPYEGQLWLNTTNNILYVYTEADGWIANQSEINGVQNVAAAHPLVAVQNENTVVIGIKDSSTTDSGSVRLATNVETSTGTAANIAVTPSGLKYVLNDTTSNFLPAASETTAGIVQLATNQEVVDGTSTDKAITPAGLQASLPSFGLTNPSGSVIIFAGDTAPTGYLECNGQELDRTQYADLFAAIGVYYGSGNNSTTFNIPDLRGEFVRGWSHGKSTDNNRQLGTFQPDGIGAHKHSFTASPIEGNDPNQTYGIGQTTINGMRSIDTNVNVNYTDETRPRNIAMMYCIKY